VVHNGVPRPEESAPVAGEGIPPRPLRVLLPGRFSSWKGQGLLVDAISRLDRDRIRVRLVGDAFPGQEHHVSRTRDRIRDGELQDTVALEGFADDPTPLYHWSDLVVMPSLKPEPFGMVAIEAMSHGRPVVAADHGGLREIVVDGETGRRFRPGDPDALAGAIREYLENPSLLAEHGEAGRRRQRNRFDERSYASGIRDAIRDTIDPARKGAARPGRRTES
jgi:glycosyltransferase involved in cell wall biosynthesis